MSLAKQEFTDAGRSMLGRAQNGERLTISKITVGSGTATQPSELWPLTALKVREMDAVISTKRDYGQGTLLVEGSIRSDLAPRAFYLREVGILAHIGAEADRLYSVANCFAEPADYIDPASPTVQVFKIKLIIDRIPTANLVVTIGPSENVTGQNQLTDAEGPGVYKDALGNVLRFKRLIAGPHIDLTEDTNADSITIGVKVVERDLDFYVPLTYPGITDPASLFPTIQAALDSVADLIIPSGRFVTVHVYSGNFPQTVPTLVTHPNASQIKIIGLDLVQLPVTGNITVAGTLPNFDVTVNVANAPVAVGDAVYLFQVPNLMTEMAGYVLAKTASTVKIRMRGTVALIGIAASAATRLVVFPTQYSITGNLAIFQTKYGVGLIKNFGFRSTGASGAAGVAVSLTGDGDLENLCAIGFDIGFGNKGGTMNLLPVVAAAFCGGAGMEVAPFAGCLVGPPSSLGFNRVNFSGNLNYGMWINGGSFYSVNNTYTFANFNATGVRCDNGYWASGCGPPETTGGAIIAWNQQGCVAALGGQIFTANNSTNTIQANITWDCRASSARVSIVHNQTNTGRYSPALGVLGPDGGFVSVQTP